MRPGARTLVALAALAIIVAVWVTDQVLPASGDRALQVRPWVAARALGVTAYLLLALDVGLGVLMSHPSNKAAWKATRDLFPWHELLTAFTWAFLVLHVVLLAIDPFAQVGWLGALLPGLATYRPAGVALGTVGLYALLVTTVTARWTRLLPAGWWLRIHRFTAVAFLLAWSHAMLAGTDGGALTPLYAATGLPVVALIAHRWWTVRGAPARRAPVAVVAGSEA